MITLYTVHCPACKVLEKKLIDAGVDFDMIDDEETILKVGQENGIMSAPFLQVDDEVFKFGDAVKWVKTQKEAQNAG